MALLMRFRNGKPAGETKLGDNELLIGNDAYNNLVLDDEGVGKRHALIEKVGDRYRITDLSASGGTIISGQEVDQQFLADQDIIQIGSARLVFVDDEIMPSTMAIIRADAASPPKTAKKADKEFGQDLFSRLGKSVLSALDFEKLPQIMLDEMIKFFSGERGVILSMDDSTGRLVPRMARKMDEELGDRDRFKVIINFALRSIDQGRTIISTTAEEAKTLKNTVPLGQMNRSMMACPVVINKQPSVVLYVDVRQVLKAFDDNDRNNLDQFALYSSVAWKNAEIYKKSNETNGDIKRVINALNFSILLLDGLGRIILANACINRENSDISGQSIEEYLSLTGEDKMSGIIRDFMKKGQAQKSEVLRIDTDDGSKNIRLSMMTLGSGTKREYLLYYQDHSWIDEKLRLDSWDQAGEGMMSFIASRIKGMGMQAKKQKKALGASQSKTAKEFIRINDDLLSNISEISHFVRTFKDFSTIHGDSFSPLKLDFISPILDEYRGKFKHIIFELQAKKAISKVNGNKEMLKLALGNLIDNGIESIKGPGRISTLIIEDREKVTIVIEDTGSGMDEAVRNKAFLPGFTTKADSVGMGLSIARKIIVLHGGSLDILTLAGQGTTISIKLPK